jgi:hypothetical protein
MTHRRNGFVQPIDRHGNVSVERYPKTLRPSLRAASHFGIEAQRVNRDRRRHGDITLAHFPNLRQRNPLSVHRNLCRTLSVQSSRLEEAPPSAAGSAASAELATLERRGAAAHDNERGGSPGGDDAAPRKYGTGFMITAPESPTTNGPRPSGATLRPCSYEARHPWRAKSTPERSS